MSLHLTLSEFIFTGVTGASPRSVFVFPIFSTTSMPLITAPKTGCFDWPGPNQSRKSLCTVLMKNCDRRDGAGWS